MRATLNPVAVAALLSLCAAPASALTLDLPAPARETASVILPLASYALPTATWNGTSIPSRLIEGRVERRAWRIDLQGSTSLELLAPLRAQLLDLGYQTIFQCETKDCGGFDFRFATEVLPEPDMHVDLGDFRFLSAVKGDEAVSLLVSRSTAAGFVQVTHIGPAATPEVVAAPAPIEPPLAAELPSSPLARLTETGSLALDDLQFEPGASDLETAKYPSLIVLSGWLAGNPARRVTLVGHTDTFGGLDANVAVSRARAQSVVDVLVSSYGVSPAQLTAEGVGYLAPRATNLTAEGRALNRRVEAVVTGTE